MTLEHALDLQAGDYVCHPARLLYRRDGTPVQAPIRVTKVWVNERKTIVLMRAHAVAGEQWVDATGYDMPPEGLVFDRHDVEWMTPAEQRQRKILRRYQPSHPEQPAK